MMGDFLWELVPLHIAVFHCDKKLLWEFLQSYGYNKYNAQSARLMMIYTLLHPCDAMRTVYQWKPEFRKIKDFESMTKIMWDLSEL